MPKNINCITIIITLEGIEKIKNLKKKTKEQSEQSHNCLQGEWILLNPSMKIHHQVKLARNYKILPFKFSKIVRDERKFP